MDMLDTAGKEFYQMRYSKNPDTPWPTSPEFKATSLDLFWKMRALTKICLHALALGVKTDPHNFLELLDSDEDINADPETFCSSTIYRYFRYQNKNHTEDPCKTHSDIGLVTLIPATAVPQLQMIHPHTYDWMHVETVTKATDEFLFFCGETMERLTACYYRAPIHRVGYLGEAEFMEIYKEKTARGEKIELEYREDDEGNLIGEFPGGGRVPMDAKPRYSVVWLCRARPDAILDTPKLNSDVIGKVYWDYADPKQVAVFMKEKYSTKLSANGLNTNNAQEPGFPAVNIPLQEESTGASEEG
eukprot:TRINITY_DN1862_c0_g1_i1.p2 TRINITY_DN1862_c0_g1~~TRINITY_DN1862_c0_g1_i1.p2  ORF type:complete len:329 (+),score=52.37 TRINITY_DN1862_c0_g1_i1:83-988(+)